VRAVDEIELDLGRYELRRRGRPVKLEKKAMELLIFLVSRKEQLVSRKDIVTKLWRSDLFIDTEPNINNIVRKIRTALRDDSTKPRFLETVVGKGYRFIGSVHVIDTRFPQSDFAQSPAGEANRERAFVRGERASLAVVPLLLLGDLPDHQGVCLEFGDGLVSRLGNLQGVDVLPTAAVLNVPAEMTASDVGSCLGVRFVVHGAIRESKGQWSLSLEMFDAHLQGACFTRKCDLDLKRLSELENEVAKQIAGALNRPLRLTAVQRRPRYSKDPLAYAEFMRGYRLSSSGDPATLDEAAQCLSTAVARGPGFSLAHAALSFAWPCRAICLTLTTVWARFWRTSVYSVTLVKCMSEGGRSIRKRQSVTASSRSMSGVESTTWLGKRFKRGDPITRGTSIPSILLRSQQTDDGGLEGGKGTAR
jgi:DNA-binding winged helix-turn-helix (wHTH) protein